MTTTEPAYRNETHPHSGLPRHPYRCPECGGVRWLYRAWICHGTEAEPHEGELMRIIDAEGAPDNTPFLDCR